MNGQYIAGKRLTCCTAQKGWKSGVVSAINILPFLVLNAVKKWNNFNKLQDNRDFLKINGIFTDFLESISPIAETARVAMRRWRNA